MEFAPKPTNKIEQKEEIKNLEGIDFVFSENPELKKIALESIEPSFEDKKKIFEMLRTTLIDTVRDTSEYEKYNGKTLAVSNFSEESFELLLQGLEENNIDIKPQLDNFNKTLEEQTSQEVIPEGADVMDYFNPSTGMFSAFTSEQEKTNSVQSTRHSMELLNYLETKDVKAREAYEKYLETIFPESKVEDIVYHGTKYDFDEFSNEYKGKGSGNDTNVDLGFYFAKNRATAGIFTEGAYAHEATPLLEKLHKEGREEDRVHIVNQMTGKTKPLFQKGVYGKFVATKDSKILPVLLNIKNPHTIDGSKFAETYDPKKNLEENRELTSELQMALQESDGIIVDTEDPHTPFSEELNSDNFIVPNPEQIHILGSQKDQEMFKEFIEKEKNDNKKVTITIGKYETGATVDSSVYENIPTTELYINEIIRLEPESKMESEESTKAVQELVGIINQGKKDELPPILVRALKDGYQIIDGHHRYEAYLQTNTETITVKIIPESEIEIIYNEDSDTESPLQRFGISSIGEFQQKFFESDQELMKTGNFDYKNNELLNNRMKDYLEEIDISQISEQAKQKQAEMLWLWYHHAAQDAKARYQENEKAIEFIDKALEYKDISNSPNEITELLSLLYRDKFEEAESYIQNMDNTRNEQQEDGSIQEVVNYEKETAQQLFEYYKKQE